MGMSQEALATDAGVRPAHISRIEIGLVNPTLELLDRISQALRVDVVALLLDVVEGATATQNLQAGQKA
jgi:transcriptional regulator with XRE-family HTH domain